MADPILVVMAAGMGSRYGGLKQIDPITEQGEIIIDFSLYDARMAGFEKVVFIIKHEIEEDVRRVIDAGAGKHLDVEYVFQELDDLPAGFSVPEGRVKPWGTCHAILAARKAVDGPFAVINADDFYGAHAFQLIYDHLTTARDDDKERYAMVGYQLRNTLSETGYVTRGVCVKDAAGYLTGVDERMKIRRIARGIAYTEDDEHWIELPEDATVSMNLWGFTPSFLKELEDGFPVFLEDALRRNPLKGEYLLPTKVDELIRSGRATVKVLETDERWYGVTYREDKAFVSDALQALKDKGYYPDKLWR
jgi:NDP-sugar pyrophosphorylase family protein